MVDPLATPDDVRGEIDTRLDDTEIQFYIDDAAFENEQANAVDTQSDDLRIRIERKVAAVKILEQKEREASDESVGSVSYTYDDVSTVQRLKEKVAELDPSGDIFPDTKVGGTYEVF